ncbi:C10 family peptidase [Acanthopleuribacter pedis]|uniref:C10 family peptidase n=2 Tax=Acanthopleuribacter pedis TaxID=442870 RepID=A0A8J7QKZ1_9BACT|nr:C10 family peptidase [Acanthopleuribacter pedis]
MIQSQWGQGAPYNRATPTLNGEPTYPGCTTLALAQLLNYYRYRDHGVKEVVYAQDNDSLQPNQTEVDLTAVRFDWANMPNSLDGASNREKDTVATFLYWVGVALNVQFDLGDGSPASGKQLENAVRYAFGYNNISRRKMYVALRATGDGFKLYSDAEWYQMVIDELDQGRPVLHMARNQNGDGHAFLIDGYNAGGLVHVNWGWAGHANGYYDLFHLQPRGSESVWNEEAMIYIGLEPEAGFAAAMAPPVEPGDSTAITERGTVAAGEWLYYGPFTTAAGLEVTMAGDGDADLYVRRETRPTSEDFDCRPYEETSNEHCGMDAAGTYYIGVNGYETSSNFTLQIVIR